MILCFDLSTPGIYVQSLYHVSAAMIRLKIQRMLLSYDRIACVISLVFVLLQV